MSHDTNLPAISEATFPSAVVVVVAALRTPRLNFLKNSLASTGEPFAWPAFRVSERPGISDEFWYSVTIVPTANFWLAILSASR
jgi:hypothetical protein